MTAYNSLNRFERWISGISWGINLKGCGFEDVTNQRIKRVAWAVYF